METELITRQAELSIIEPGQLDQNPAAVYLNHLTTEAGRRTMRQSLNTIAAMVLPGSNAYTFPWSRLRFQHTAAIRARLAERYNRPATANRMIYALRGVLKAAWQLEQMTGEDYYRAADIESIKGDTIPAGRGLSSGEITGLMAACQQDPGISGIRDAAIISLMYMQGPRRSEVVRINLQDVEQLEGGAYRIKLLGKGKQERYIYADNGAADAMADWLAVRGDIPGALFQPIDKGGLINRKRLTTQAIYTMLLRRAEVAGVRKFSPHDLRRTFVSDLLDAGADIATVARIAGHASIDTTAKYDRRPEMAKQKAASLLHVPYRRRKA